MVVVGYIIEALPASKQGSTVVVVVVGANVVVVVVGANVVVVVVVGANVVVVVVEVVVVVVVTGEPPVYPKLGINTLLPPINDGGGGYELTGTPALTKSRLIGPEIVLRPPVSLGIGL